MDRDEKRRILVEWFAWFVTSEFIQEFWARDTLQFAIEKLRALDVHPVAAEGE